MMTGALLVVAAGFIVGTNAWPSKVPRKFNGFVIGALIAAAAIMAYGNTL